MDVDYLRYQMQKMDGSPESVLQAVDLLFSTLKANPGPLPKSVEHHFFEETSRSVLEWIGKGMNKTVRDVLSSLDELILFDPELAYPLAHLDAKKRLSAMISFLCEIMSVYLRTDLEWKDQQKILGEGKTQDRLRLIMVHLFSLPDRFSLDEALNSRAHEHHKPLTQKREMNRDLKKLEEFELIRQTSAQSSKKHYYELTTRAHYYKEQILDLYKKQRPPVTKPKTAKKVIAMKPDAPLLQMMEKTPKITFVENTAVIRIKSSRKIADLGRLGSFSPWTTASDTFTEKSLAALTSLLEESSFTRQMSDNTAFNEAKAMFG